MSAPRLVRVAHARVDGAWHADAVLRLGDDGVALADGDEAAARDLPRLDLALLPPLTDAHVHLALADLGGLEGSRIARVLDLGADPAAVPGLADAARATHPALDVRFAGAFLTAPGGYPSDRAWAPPGGVVEVAGGAAAAAAVRAQAAAGASLVKLVSNTDDGPALDDEALAAAVAEAHALGLRVAVHAQGGGQPERAIAAGADVLAHTPWTHPLADDVVRRAAGRTVWISTLGMHARDGDDEAFARATDNLARFAAGGGTVAYGTDLGNGSSRLDLDEAEVAALRQAGVEGEALVDALTAARLLPGGPVASAFPPDVDGDAAALASLHRSRPVRITDLEAPR
ncbi:hydrolase [Agrococcus sediminis]|uniref:hydrolase n=1 Tax=Agrococcus sediminis TaxID=2599924 RepID=UPI001788B9F1|nr:hydrolase [Agrococcus sediminis]